MDEVAFAQQSAKPDHLHYIVPFRDRPMAQPLAGEMQDTDIPIGFPLESLC